MPFGMLMGPVHGLEEPCIIMMFQNFFNQNPPTARGKFFIWGVAHRENVASVVQKRLNRSSWRLKQWLGLPNETCSNERGHACASWQIRLNDCVWRLWVVCHQRGRYGLFPNDLGAQTSSAAHIALITFSFPPNVSMNDTLTTFDGSAFHSLDKTVVIWVHKFRLY